MRGCTSSEVGRARGPAPVAAATTAGRDGALRGVAVWPLARADDRDARSRSAVRTALAPSSPCAGVMCALGPPAHVPRWNGTFGNASGGSHGGPGSGASVQTYEHRWQCGTVGLDWVQLETTNRCGCVWVGSCRVQLDTTMVPPFHNSKVTVARRLDAERRRPDRPTICRSSRPRFCGSSGVTTTPWRGSSLAISCAP